MDPEYAKAYARLYRSHWWWRAREEFLVSVLDRWLPQGPRGALLDVGCGAGLLFRRLEAFGEVFGVEPNTDMRTGLEDSEGQIHWGTLESYSPTRRFRAVLMLDVLEHLERPEDALRTAANLLDGDGIVVLTVPAFTSIWTSHDVLNEHLTRYTKGTLKPLVEAAGLVQLECRYFFNWLWPVKLVVRMLEAVKLPGAAGPRVPSVPTRAVNQALFAFSRAEQALGISGWCPFGSSLLFVGKKSTWGSRPA